MKKVIILSYILSFSLVALWARTPEQAADIASHFIAQRGSTQPIHLRMQRAAGLDAQAQAVDLAYTHRHTDESAAFYVFNGKEDGFVLISAHDHARTILGYADHGQFDANDIPQNMQLWLKMYAEEINKVKGERLEVKGKSLEAKDKDLGAQYPVVEPLLGDMQWGQGKPYNNHCPIVDGERSVAGCVATALSQIMYVHKHPAQGTGNYSYRLRNGVTVSADFSQATYDWDNMLPRYKGNSYTTEQADAVAELMFHVGVASNMQYSPSASGSSSGIALQGLNSYLGYDAGVIALPKDYMPENQVLEGIANDLVAGRPVFISAYTSNYEGHAFVCDGMQSNGYLHINWGWTGTSDGYFSISALDPGQQGTGGSASNLAFTVDVCAYTNIRPDEGGTAIWLMTADALTLKSKSAIKRTSDINYELYILCNNGVGNANGKFVYNIYDQQDQLVQSISLREFSLKPGYWYELCPLNGKISNVLPEGDYNLVVGFQDRNDLFQPVLIQGRGAVKNAITITKDSVYFHAEQSPQLPETLAVDFTQISGTNTWQMDLYTPNFWESEATDELLIRCRLNGNSTTSVIGTYLLDKSNTAPANTNSIYLKEVVCAIGNGQECGQYTPTALQLTILQDENGMLGVHYTFEVNFKRYKGYAALPNVTWSQLADNQTIAYDEHITYDAATALPASKALEIAKTYKESYSMEYLVQGVVSSMTSTPETIVQNQEAQFTISTNGDREESFLCNHIQWLDQAPYTTGEEIQNNDELVILGMLTTQAGSPQVNGSTYAHQRPEWTAPITEFIFSVDAMKMIAKWASEAKYFKVRLYDEKDKKIADNTISKKELTATMPELGAYTFWIRPMDKNKKDYTGPAIEQAFVIDGTSSALDYTTLPATATLYDLLGNRIGTVEEATPSTGIYILVSEQGSRTIFIP